MGEMTMSHDSDSCHLFSQCLMSNLRKVYVEFKNCPCRPVNLGVKGHILGPPTQLAVHGLSAQPDHRAWALLLDGALRIG